MHLVSSVPKYKHSSLYHSDLYLATVRSLPYIFRKLRIFHNLTKSALAEKILVTEEDISHIEDGRKFPSLKYCIACGELFGFNPEWVKLRWSKVFMDRVERRLMQHLGLNNGGEERN